METRAQFHLGTTHLMEMMIALNSSFREDQNRPKDHQIWTSINVFLNLCEHMCKMSRSTSSSCRLMKPNGHDSSPSTTYINTSSLSPHLASSSHTYLLSRLIGSYNYWANLLSLTRVVEGRFFWANCRAEFHDCCKDLTNVDRAL